MRNHGVLRLKVSGSSVKEFTEMFPDAKSWLTMFKPTDSVASAMKELKYSGPPELLTMHLCMIGNKDLDYSIAWLKSHVSAIRRCQVSSEAALGFGPLPAWCVQTVEQQDCV
jgi:hypothetical protein